MRKDIRHVAMYLRISQEKDDKNADTLENHRELLTEYCERYEYTYEEFGEVVSGGSSELENRPKLQELLDNIEKFDAILVVELSRLSRNNYISQKVKQTCIDYDIPIITLTKVFYLSNREDSLLFDITSSVSSYEHGIIGMRSKINKITMTKQGKHVSGNVPYGYYRDPVKKVLKINKEEAEVVRLIFDWHKEGYGSYKIRDMLNAQGYKPAKSVAFNLPSIKRIIRNPAYKGTLVFHDRKRVKEKGKTVYKILKTYEFEEAHDAIIDPKEWEEANRTREDRAIKAGMIREKPMVKTDITMLKDLIFCGYCGRKMAIRKDNKADHYYIKICDNLLLNSAEKCMNAGINLEYVLKKFTEKLLTYKKEVEEELEDILKQDVSKIVESIHENLRQMERELIELEKQYQNLLDMGQVGAIKPNDLVVRTDSIEQRKIELAANKEKLSTQLTELDLTQIEANLRGMLSILEQFEQFQDADASVQNEYVKTFVKAIYYKRRMPEEIRRLSTRDPRRKAFKFDLVVEYF
ncbi:recombinase family protein [Cytobacillus firmus]|uniref:recombinase family protein n=1 Tax=Cytobacillus firmus TaxID=1399 RepID=UPI0018CF4D36|nr:recombinase family protein [Cytobacillus firmus]MBG9657064.1 hypothetical protein [Cytobacillus firmus]MED1906736.1 recombinase family protein [Cytobacillus firmus]